MLKRELVKEDVAELAYEVIWREFNTYYANAQCDYLSEQLASRLGLLIEDFIENEHQRREQLEDEKQREVEVQVYG